MNNLILTEQSIIEIANCITTEILENGILPKSETYYNFDLPHNQTFVLTGKTKDQHIAKLKYIIIDKTIFDILKNDISTVTNLFFEIHTLVSRYNQNKNLRGFIPSKCYSKDNRVVIKLGKYYVFVVVNVENTGHFYVFDLKTSKPESIGTIDINLNIINEVSENVNVLSDLYKSELESRKLLLSDDYSFDLYFGDEEQEKYNYDQWLKVLSSSQKAFMEKQLNKGIKLRGPAGTGKTLVMELKAIKTLRENPNARILFTCHSWAVAIQVSDFISKLDYEIGQKIDIFPLLTLAEEYVSQESINAITLGDDSYSGKIEQLKLLNTIILQYRKVDWLVIKDSCTDSFVEQFESISQTNNNYTWDIMIEISCILGANGIMPTIYDFDKYKNLERRSWMIPLHNDMEKKVIFDVYCNLMELLEKEGHITTDQIINDYINYLTTYTWFRQRKKIGYDYIFIDEMQLFNPQEKAVLQYLTKNREEYPKLIMALDPKQSVDNIYCDMGVISTVSGIDPNIENTIGKADNFCLDIAYRYTREILSFLRHLDSCYPAMDLGDDWNNNIQKIKFNQLHGDKPYFIRCKDDDDEISNVISKANELSGNKRVAILSLQDNVFETLADKVSENKNFKIIESSKVTHRLKYVKRNVFVSKPSYVIGLQFDIVILIGCYSIYKENAPNQSYYMRRFLSDLYLGASRAKEKLFLYSNSKAPQIPTVLQTAIDKEIILDYQQKSSK